MRKRLASPKILMGIGCLAVIVALAILWQFQFSKYRFFTDGNSIHEAVGSASPRTILWKPPLELEDGINTKEDDYEPRLSADGFTLLLVRGRPGANADIYVSRRSREGWSMPISLASVNSEYDDLGPELSPNGRLLYFYSNRPGGFGGYDLWVSPLAVEDSSEFGLARNLGPEVNTGHNEYGPAVSPDGSILFFASNRPPHLELKNPSSDAWPATLREDLHERTYDLYSANLSDDRAEAAEAVVALNTRYNEGAAAFSPLEDFLYFGSDRPGGAGGFDLYRSRRVRDRLEQPVNLGPTINSAANELDPAVTPEGFGLVFSSDRMAAEDPSNRPADYDLYRTSSREVFVDSETIPIHWAALWDLIGPNFLWAVLALLLMLLLATFLFGTRGSKLGLFARCLVASLVAHLLLMFMFNAWQVTVAVAGTFDREGGGLQVALTPNSVMQGVVYQLTGPFDTSALLAAEAVSFQRAPTGSDVTISCAPVSMQVESASVPKQEPMLMDISVTDLRSLSANVDSRINRTKIAPLEKLSSVDVSLPEIGPVQQKAENADDAIRRTLPNADPVHFVPQSFEGPQTKQVAMAVEANGPDRSEESSIHWIEPSTAIATSNEMLSISKTEVVNPSLPVSNLVLEGLPEAKAARVMETNQGFDRSTLPVYRPALSSISKQSILLMETRTLAIQSGTLHVKGSLIEPADSHAKALADPVSFANGMTFAKLPRETIGSGADRTADWPQLEEVRVSGETVGAPGIAGETPRGISRYVVIGTTSNEWNTTFHATVVRPGRSQEIASLVTVGPGNTSIPSSSTSSLDTESWERLSPLVGSDDMIDLSLPMDFESPPNPYAQRSPEVREELVEKMGGSPETERAVALALSWLARHQSKDGHWDGDGFDDTCGRCDGQTSIPADVALTGLSIFCFLGADHSHAKAGPYQETVRKALDWLVAHQALTGDLRGEETMYSQGIATIALAEALAMTFDPRLRQPAQKAVQFIAQARNPSDGGWRYDPGQAGDTSVLGWQMMAIKSAMNAGLTVPPSAIRGAERWLDRVGSSKTPGRYAYQPGQDPTPTMTAEGMFVRQLLGTPREDSRMTASAEFIEGFRPAWSEPNTYFWYYATLALFHHQGESWDSWNQTLVAELVPHQSQDRGEAGSWDPIGPWADVGGRIYQTALCTLMLEVYYRYLPMYNTGMVAKIPSFGAPAAPVIYGRVFDAQTRKLLPKATVTLDRSTGEAVRARTNQEGAFRLKPEDMPEFAALTASHPDYVPQTLNVAASALADGEENVEFVLEPLSADVVAIEMNPNVHHLGDNRFDGTINSRFQKASEGAHYRAEFILTPAQLQGTNRAAELRFLAKGVQRGHWLVINDQRLKQQLDHAPKDGSFGEFTTPIAFSWLKEGANVFEIFAQSLGDDVDDFEFVNVRIRLLTDAPSAAGSF